MASTNKNAEREAFDAQLLELAGEIERGVPDASSAKDAPATAVSQTDPGVLEKMESLLDENYQRIEELVSTLPVNEVVLAEVLEQLKRKNALESANEKLFETLHEELRGYKDAFLFESLQKPVARDLISLMDDLHRLPAQFSSESPETALRNLDNTVAHLREILHRLEVVEIPENLSVVDLRFHKITAVEPAASREDDGKILRIVRTGYQWRNRILRPQEVVVARWEEEFTPVSES